MECKSSSGAPRRAKSYSNSLAFLQVGVDILGPYPIAPKQLKFLVVVVDYFTKWIEAEPLSKITIERIVKFYWKSLASHLGVPYVIVTDNGTQFSSSKVKDLCDGLKIK